jgi:hypothetical protein
MDNDFYVGLLLETAEKSARAGEGHRAVRLIVDHIREIPEAGEPVAEYLDPFDQLDQREGHERQLETAIVRLLASADAWREQGAPVDERVDLLQQVPEPLRRRLVAEHLRRSLPTDGSQARVFLIEQLAAGRAFPEGVQLVDAVIREGGAAEAEKLIAALGDAPAAAEVANWPDSEPFPDHWVRGQTWLAVLPEEHQGNWKSPMLVLNERYGRPRPDGRLTGDVSFFSGPTSPFSAAELDSSSPVEAAERIGAWVPDRTQDFGPTPRGLERTLQEVVKKNAPAWSTNALEIISKLRHPTYIYGYFNGLEGASDEVVNAARDVAEAALVVLAKPWRVDALHDDPFEADQDWDAAATAAIDLLGKLAAAGGDFEDLWVKVCAGVYSAAEESHDQTGVRGDNVDALTAALNRASTRALNAAFSLSEHEPREGEPLSAAFLAVVDHWLTLDDESAIDGRAMIASRLPYLRLRNPSWFEAARPRLIGDDAPRNMGHRTFDLYLKWGRPRRELLEEETPSYLRGIKTERQAAIQHILHGFLWRIEPYADPSWTLKAIADVDVSAISTAAGILARFANGATDESVLEKSVEFWRAALDLDLKPAAYPGFGDFADIESLEDSVWLDLTLETLERSGGAIDSAREVSSRAAKTPASPASTKILLLVLEGELELWEVAPIARNAQEALQRPQAPGSEDSRRRLREFLLQRGFYEARDLGGET